MSGLGCLALTIGLLLTVLFPFIFADIMATALLKLRLSPTAAFLIVVGIFVGGLVNIPIRRIVREEDLQTHPLSAFGLWAFFPGGSAGGGRRSSRPTWAVV